MSGDLLQTKLVIPPSRSSLVPRPQLRDTLNEGVRSGCKLTLISAPAGFGKTTLVSEWLSHYPHDAAWVSLDDGDNDPARFLTYVVATLQKVEPGLGEGAIALLNSPQPTPIQSVITSLLNDIASIEDLNQGEFPVALILDDYHLIDAKPIHEAVNFLLENLPPQLHLVIVGRSDPPLSLSRFRARGQMLEIRQSDLRFTGQEATIFLNDMMGLSLSAGQVEVLERRTEGWIAGLQLAAISLRGRDDIAEFITTFSGSHRFVMDYLAEEVLQQQEEHIRRFLFQTVILNRLTADLCDVITGQNDSQTVLRRLDQENLFIIPLDDERRWYRYHHLFADLLRQHSDKGQQAEILELHRRAADWYEEQGYITEAIDHWQAAGELSQAIRLMEENALSTLNRGEIFTVLNWLTKVPPELVPSFPWLCLAQAWTSLLTGQIEGLETDLQDAVRGVTASGDEANILHVLGHVSAIQAYLTLMMGDSTAATQHAQEALERLPEEDASTRSVVTYTLGGAYLMHEDIEGACRAFAEAGSSGEAAGNVHLATSALSALGMLQVQYGQLHLALDTFTKAQQVATSKSGRAAPVAASAYNGQGIVFYEWNDLEAAATYLEKAFELAEVWGNADALISSYVYLSRVRLAQENPDNALSLLHQANRLTQGVNLTPPTEALLAAQWINTWLAKGDLSSAKRHVRERGLTAQDRVSYVREVEYLALARFLLVQNKAEQAASLLTRLQQKVEMGGRFGSMIAILVLQAVTFEAQSRRDSAIATLEKAFDLAAPEGYLRTFVDAGEPMQVLLQQTAALGVSPDYRAKLLVAFPASEPGKSPMSTLSSGELLDPLTDQELKVLRLIAAGLSNREVAEELYLSINTVKWYLKNIYEKLDVHSRVMAVARAQELDLL